MIDTPKDYKRKEHEYFIELETFIKEKEEHILRKCKKCGLPMEVIDAFDKGDQAVSMCNHCHVLHHNQTNEDCSLYYIDKVKRKVNRK